MTQRGVSEITPAFIGLRWCCITCHEAIRDRLPEIDLVDPSQPGGDYWIPTIQSLTFMSVVRRGFEAPLAGVGHAHRTGEEPPIVVRRHLSAKAARLGRCGMARSAGHGTSSRPSRNGPYQPIWGVANHHDALRRLRLHPDLHVPGRLRKGP